MILIDVCQGVVAFGLLWPVIVFAICCASMGRLVEPFPVGEWYGQTLPPLAELERTRPLPVAAVPCLQEGWVREVMASIEAAENCRKRKG